MGTELLIKLTPIQQQILIGRVCPYCGKKTQYVDSAIIYGESYGMIYLCTPCNAYVGVHKNTNKSLGRVANAELRMWKIEAHKYFDRLWKNHYFKRRDAYKLLSEYLKLPTEYTHIGMFSVETCKMVVEWSKTLLNDLKQNKELFNI